VPDVNDVNGTESIIRVGTDAEAAGRELASTRTTLVPDDQLRARCPSFVSR
jgi:hypothetical protein